MCSNKNVKALDYQILLILKQPALIALTPNYTN